MKIARKNPHPDLSFAQANFDGRGTHNFKFNNFERITTISGKMLSFMLMCVAKCRSVLSFSFVNHFETIAIRVPAGEGKGRDGGAGQFLSVRQTVV